MLIEIILTGAGLVCVLIGAYLKSSTKRSNAKSVFSMMFISIGALLILYAVSQFIRGTLEGWNEYSEIFR